jgi:hypothetical protein
MRGETDYGREREVRRIGRCMYHRVYAERDLGRHNPTAITPKRTQNLTASTRLDESRSSEGKAQVEKGGKRLTLGLVVSLGIYIAKTRRSAR